MWSKWKMCYLSMWKFISFVLNYCWKYHNCNFVFGSWIKIKKILEKNNNNIFSVVIFDHLFIMFLIFFSLLINLCIQLSICVCFNSFLYFLPCVVFFFWDRASFATSRDLCVFYDDCLICKTFLCLKVEISIKWVNEWLMELVFSNFISFFSIVYLYSELYLGDSLLSVHFSLL